MALRALHGGHAGILAAIQHMWLIHRGLAGGKQLLSRRRVRSAGHMAVVGEHTHDGQLMALTHLKVVGIVRRGDLHHARALFHIGVAHRTPWGFHGSPGAASHGLAHADAHSARSSGLTATAGIAQHGFGAGGGQLPASSPVSVARDSGDARNCRSFSSYSTSASEMEVLQSGTPVDEAVALIDQALFVQA